MVKQPKAAVQETMNTTTPVKPEDESVPSCHQQTTSPTTGCRRPEGHPHHSAVPTKTINNNNKSLASWALLVLVSLCVAWVIVFTTLSTHTQVMRQHVYEALAKPKRYLPKQAGARLWTYLVAFYLIPGILTHGAAHWGGIGFVPSIQCVHSRGVPSSGTKKK